MAKMSDHPTVKKMKDPGNNKHRPADAVLDHDWLRDLVLNAGADDVGFVSIDRAEVTDQREELEQIFRGVRTLISIVVKMNREPIRSPMRSVANGEFHHQGDIVNEISHKVVAVLEAQGYRAMNPPMAFPMEVNRFPGKMWVVSHKPIAEAAGLGKMGIHRNVIHPQFGNFILLGTILLGHDVTRDSTPIDYNPCFECKLCVAACPVGAISTDGWFDFNACYTHNYREFLGGFVDWTNTLTDSSSATDYGKSFTTGETVSMWQSLAFEPNYKAAYCMAVCPAGEDVISPYLADKGGFLKNVVKPLQQKEETIYVVPGSDAETKVTKRFPHKTIKHVANGISVDTISVFLDNMGYFFQREQSEGLNAVYHFVFSGESNAQATVTIRDKTITVVDGLHGAADITVRADAHSWVRFLNRKMTGVFAVMTRKIRIKGDPRLLIAFGNCFPF